MLWFRCAVDKSAYLTYSNGHSQVCRARLGGPSKINWHKRWLCVCKNALWSLTVKSRQNRIELVTRPATSAPWQIPNAQTWFKWTGKAELSPAIPRSSTTAVQSNARGLGQTKQEDKARILLSILPWWKGARTQSASPCRSLWSVTIAWLQSFAGSEVKCWFLKAMKTQSAWCPDLPASSSTSSICSSLSILFIKTV